MPKKNTVLKGLGPRYGIKIRKSFTKVHHLMKQKRKAKNMSVPLLVESELQTSN